MLYLIGLGLGDAEDVSVKGLNIIKKAYKIYLEAYTSLLTVGKEKLEEYYGREIILADREMVEQGADEIIDEAKDHDVAFLVVGDPFGATTHTDLVLRAQEKSVPYSVVHNASILSAVGCCGLQLYSFGETVSIVFWTEDWKPDSFYDRILANRKRGLHTLCLMGDGSKDTTTKDSGTSQQLGHNFLSPNCYNRGSKNWLVQSPTNLESAATHSRQDRGIVDHRVRDRFLLGSENQ
ncbi:DPH5, partial [Cordylochernes scorpioides]